ncbi:MAG: NTPase [Chloroflexota bacterium]|nr:NTPase [Chloroflexota bacterium]
MGENKTAFLITGRPGCGKTTLIRRLVEALGVSAGGFYTEEIRGRGRREGFALATLDGQSATLASIGSASRHRVSRYGVNLDAIDEVGAPAIERATAGAALVVIDEIGKMELLSNRFRQAVLAALESGKPMLGSIMLAPHPWADAIKSRPEVSLILLSEANRRQVEDQLLAELRARLGHRSS